MNDIEARVTAALRHPSWDADIRAERVLDDVLDVLDSVGRRRAPSGAGRGRTWLGVSAGVAVAACAGALTVLLAQPATPVHRAPVGHSSTPAPSTSPVTSGATVPPSPRCALAGSRRDRTAPELPPCPSTGRLTAPSSSDSPTR